MTMIKYLKQSWHSITTEKQYAALYITGVALSIAMVMVLSIILYSRLSPIYPAYNRGSTMYMEYLMVKMQWGSMTSGLSLAIADNWLRDVEGIDHVSLMEERSDTKVSVPGSQQLVKGMALYTDPGYFSIYGFKFLEGRPLNAEDMESGAKSVVITDRIAERTFGSAANAIGHEIEVNFVPHKVVGVVEGASAAVREAYYELFLPYSLIPDFDLPDVYPFKAVVLTKDGADKDAIRSEIAQRAMVYSKDKDEDYQLWGQPFTHYQITFSEPRDPDEEEEEDHYLGYYVMVGLILLIVPALNLSGLIVGRMDRRTSEMGIRKSFGATRGNLLWQVLVENLALTLIGVMAGLVLAWLAVYVNRDWIFSILDKWVANGRSLTKDSVSLMSLFSPWVFLIALVATLLLNALSSLIPAWSALRRPIVESLNEKR